MGVHSFYASKMMIIALCEVLKCFRFIFVYWYFFEHYKSISTELFNSFYSNQKQPPRKMYTDFFYLLQFFRALLQMYADLCSLQVYLSGGKLSQVSHYSCRCRKTFANLHTPKRPAYLTSKVYLLRNAAKGPHCAGLRCALVKKTAYACARQDSQCFTYNSEVEIFYLVT